MLECTNIRIAHVKTTAYVNLIILSLLLIKIFSRTELLKLYQPLQHDIQLQITMDFRSNYLENVKQCLFGKGRDAHSGKNMLLFACNSP